MNLPYAALQLAERNLAVFPLLPRDKRPATPHGVKDATTCADTVARWWRQDPNFNIGLACGSISDILVTDVDGPDAEAGLHKLEKQHSPLPPTVESITARGRHIFFKWPGRDIRNSVGALAPGIDVRATGGYVVVPPSIHPSGKRYCWSVESASTFAQVPVWLLNRITEPANKGRPSSLAPEDWCGLIYDGVDEGRRTDSIVRLAGHLLGRRINPQVALELVSAFNDARCRPPLSRDVVIETVNNIAGRELKKRLGL